MRAYICAMSIVAAGLARPALAANPYSDTAYDVRIQYAGEQSSSAACVTFDPSGRLSIAGRRTSLVWAQRPELPLQFLAVTAPLQGTGVETLVGIAGEILADKTLLARGVDEFGATFELRGTRSNGCSTSQTESRASDSPLTGDTLYVGDFSGEFDPAAIHPCSTSFCDPVVDPLRGETAPVFITQLVQLGIQYGAFAAPCATSFCDPVESLLRSVSSPGFVKQLVDLGIQFGTSTTSCVTSFCDPVPSPLRSAPLSDFVMELANLGIQYGVSGTFCATSYCDPAIGLLRAQAATEPTAGLVNFGVEYGASTTPCAMNPCDPHADPLDVLQDRATSELFSQSFSLTLGSGQQVIEYCWTFRNDGIIDTAPGTSMTWSAQTRASGSSGFQSVGRVDDELVAAYVGELEGNLLKVSGIEAQDGKSMVTHGWGQPVASCPIIR